MDNQVLALDKYVDELINEKFGAGPLGAEARAEIKKELAERLNQYITLRTIENISIASPEAIPQLETLIKSNPTPEQVNAFINERVEQPDVLVAQILSDFHSLYIGKTNETH